MIKDKIKWKTYRDEQPEFDKWVIVDGKDFPLPLLCYLKRPDKIWKENTWFSYWHRRKIHKEDQWTYIDFQRISFD